MLNNISFRSLLITFRYFDTEFGHDELLIGETITDVSKYNSKLYRFSGSKIPDPCLIVLRGDVSTRAIWMEFTSDQTNTGSGFILDYQFQQNQSKISPSENIPIIFLYSSDHSNIETQTGFNRCRSSSSIRTENKEFENNVSISSWINFDSKLSTKLFG